MTTDKFRPIPPMTESQKKRFWKKVAIKGHDECWVWTAFLSNGYGQFGIQAGKIFLAHRLSFFLSTGIDPGENCVLHSCDNPPCCNPKHLSLGSRAENSRDMVKKGRSIKGRPNVSATLIPDNEIYLIREMFNSGLFSQSGIARIFKLRPCTVSSIVKGTSRGGVPMPICSEQGKKFFGVPHGARLSSNTSKVSEIDIYIMREMYCLGRFSITSIAKKFSLTFGATNHIVRGDTWKDIPFPAGGAAGMFAPRRKNFR